MQQLIDLEQYPIDNSKSNAYKALVERCKADLETGGMFNLPDFIRPKALDKAVGEVTYDLTHNSFKHHRHHNIFFRDVMPGLSSDDPVMQKFDSINHTICADQLKESIVARIYEYAPLRRFLADAMGKENLYLMDDPLAAVNVMSSRDGESLNWHFDQAEFTTTILLQASEEGGELEYSPDLRTENDPNYDGIIKLVEGDKSQNKISRIIPGTLNVFRGVNTPHRVTTVRGNRDRIISIFAYYEQPGVIFTDAMRTGFYGRSA